MAGIRPSSTLSVCFPARRLPGPGSSGHVEHFGNFLPSKSFAARARHDSSLMRKIAIGFLQTPVGELRTAKFHRLASKVGNDQQFRRRRAAKTRALVATQGDTFSGWGARFGDGWHNNYPGAKRRSVHAAAGPLWSLAFEVKPAWQGLSCWKNDTFCKKTSLLCGAESQRPSRVSAHITQEVADAKRQVFGAQQVWPSTKVRRRGIDFLDLMSPAARFSAGKKFLKSSTTMLVP